MSNDEARSADLGYHPLREVQESRVLPPGDTLSNSLCSIRADNDFGLDIETCG